MIWDGKRPCDFQLWDGFRRSKDVVRWFGSFALGRGGMFWTNLCALYFLLWAASSKNCRLDGKMDPQRQTPRCKRTHPGFTGWNHSKMPLQTPGGTKKVSGMDWQKASDHEVIMISSWPWLNCYLQLPICHRFVTEISDQWSDVSRYVWASSEDSSDAWWRTPPASLERGEGNLGAGSDAVEVGWWVENDCAKLENLMRQGQT